MTNPAPSLPLTKVNSEVSFSLAAYCFAERVPHRHKILALQQMSQRSAKQTFKEVGDCAVDYEDRLRLPTP